jgi:hypothetical protein
MRYADQIKAILSPAERHFFSKLSTPQKIQDYLDTIPVNFEENGETYMSPRRTIVSKKAHCLEAALLAAAALAYHGKRPLLLDMQTISDDQDHVVTLFQINGYWGAISKTNHAVLRYRDPIYRSVRELALSYFHEYFMDDGLKSLRRYSKPYDLSKYPPEKWVTAEGDLFWLIEPLDSSPHFPLVSKKNERHLRNATNAELDATDYVEWKKNPSFSKE